MKFDPQSIEKFKVDPERRLAKVKPFTYMFFNYACVLIGVSIITDLDMFDGDEIPSPRKIVMKYTLPLIIAVVQTMLTRKKWSKIEKYEANKSIDIYGENAR